MLVLRKVKDQTVSLRAKSVREQQLRAMNAPLAVRILRELATKPTYPMMLAKKLRVHEQKIYYHVRKMERARVIEVIRRQDVHGTTANIYAPIAPAFVFALKKWESAAQVPIAEPTVNEYLEPFISDGVLDATIVVGSPDPHGPAMARSRDGYYGIDLAFFLGSFLSNVSELHVRLDTEVRSEELQRNVILLGGPAVNTVTGKVNAKLPVRFDDQFRIVSTVTEKVYPDESCGMIVKAKNPFNRKKQLLVVAGKRHAGTRAAIIAFMRYFQNITENNLHQSSVPAKIVQGLDRNADGIVDDVRFIE